MKQILLDKERQIMKRGHANNYTKFLLEIESLEQQKQDIQNKHNKLHWPAPEQRYRQWYQPKQNIAFSEVQLVQVDIW